MARWLATAAIACACVLPTLRVAHANKPAADDAGWGTVEGRVVFAGDLNAAALKPYRDSVKIREPISIQDSRRGVEARVIATVPNEALLIDSKTRGVSNAFVYLKKKPARMHPSFDQPLEATECVFRGQQFSPRALVVEVGQELRLVSGDNGVSTDFKLTTLKNETIHPLVSPDKPFAWSPRFAELHRPSLRSRMRSLGTG